MTSPLSARHFNRRTFIASMGAALALAALTACNHAATGGSTDTLNVGQISDSMAFFPLFVAEEKGFFTDEGVTLGERPRLGTGAKVAAALKSGSIDLGAGVINDAFNLKSVQDDAVLVSRWSRNTTLTWWWGRTSTDRTNRPRSKTRCRPWWARTSA